MDFKPFQYVLKVAATGSITRAADELYMTQPALSHYISRLEKEEGFRIFDRSTTPLTLTYAGEKYVETIRRILELNDALSAELSDIRKYRSGRLTVGIPPLRGAVLLPRVIPEFLRIYPGIEIRTLEKSASDLKSDLLKGSADFIILPHTSEEDGFRSVEIYEEELFAVTSKDYLSSGCYTVNDRGARILDLDRVADKPFILLKNGHSNRTMMNVMFELHGITPKIFMEISNTNTAYGLAAAGLGIAVVPTYVVDSIRTPNPVDLYKLSENGLKWTVSALFHPDGSIGYLARQFVMIAKDVCGKEPEL